MGIYIIRNLAFHFVKILNIIIIFAHVAWSVVFVVFHLSETVGTDGNGG